ncbi:PepSY-associated TM helix domain-containing protein [Pseudomonas schmalbachii]|uniref:PepSY domain-containing protein n=1 Tax=Pseudomonas schmalbachii TaxID=2816993 RepID=A0ABS3TKY4_9PSED|nr:PepSY-associated TM helix domain-containing protein [Pseudomonas schmalbachii]MBO3274297.1 PepSY domain-containing protein [Pseudomonas schmalbachii]
MKRSLVQSFDWLHTWAGLFAGWLLFAVFLTGSLALFKAEIGYWMQPELHGVARVSDRDALAVAERLLRTGAEGARSWSISLPDVRDPGLQIAWQARDGKGSSRWLDPLGGTLLDVRATQGGAFFSRFHYSLGLGKPGVWIVGGLAMAMLAALVTGVVIHRRIFRDFFTFRPRAATQRAWLDAHNASGVLLLPFHLMITYTGLVLFYAFYMPAAIQALYAGDARAYFTELVPPVVRPVSGEACTLQPLGPLLERAEAQFGVGRVASLLVQNPGDAGALVHVFRSRDDRLARVSDALVFDGCSGGIVAQRLQPRASYLTERVMGGLHFAHFGGDFLRWLYFLAGLGSCAMIVTGLLLFTLKRERSGRDAAVVRLAARLNPAAVGGTLLACAAYLLANRLLPAGLAGRAGWEVGSFFAAWGAALLYACVRPPARLWSELLAGAALLAMLVPLVNGLTCDSHLLRTLPQGDWRLALVDLTALASGLLLAALAIRLRRQASRRDVAANATPGGPE